MMDITEHYAQLMGVNSPWLIEDVKLDMTNQRVDIYVDYTAKEGPCPECNCNAPRYDDRQERIWRHLDTMQFTTYLHCRVPRVRCTEHGVKTLITPWATKHSGFTLLFEAFAIQLLQVARSIEEARKLLGLNWHQLNDIKSRAVERGLARRKDETVRNVGIDEKQFRAGHHYISSLVDLDQGRVLDVVEDRTEKAAKLLLNKGLSAPQQAKVEAVALDMWPAYANAVNALLPSAAIVHDRFHISQHLNQAVDLVRRQENRELSKQDDHRLRGTKYMWLCNEENQHERFTDAFMELKNTNLKVARAWALKEQFRPFWGCLNKEQAQAHFDSWYSWAIRSRLPPIKAKAQMIKNHLTNILTYFEHRISNAVAEGLNSKIQTVKANARGFRSFKSFRYSILFYCGHLDMAP
jgi:transposase